MNKSEFARRINSTPQNVYSIFKRESIDTDLLWEISRVLNYDFFQHYTTTQGAYLNDDSMSHKTASDLNKELAQVKRDTELFAQENRYLKELVRLLRGKSEGLPFDLHSTPLSEAISPASKAKSPSIKKVTATTKQVKSAKAETPKPKSTKATKASTSKRKS